MTQKKFFQIAGIVVAFVWVFCATFAIALTIQRRPNKNVPVTNPPATTTTTPYQNPQGVFSIAPSTTQFFFPTTTAQPLPTININTTAAPVIQPTTQPTTQASSIPQSKEQILAAYINGVNALKNTPNFILNKTDKLNIIIDEITGGSMVEAFANTLIPSPSPENYTFLGGVDAATGKTPNAVIAPLDKAAACDINAVTSAVAQPNTNGGYTIQLILKEEIQTYTSPAPNLSTMVQVIDASALLPPGATIQEMNVNYAPSTITAVFDSQNRIVSMQHVLVSEGGGKGGMAFITATMKMHGDYTSDYTISYN